MKDENDVDEQATWQAQILKRVKTELDTELGKDSYSDSLIISCHNWVNKWLMSKSIQESRNNYKPTKHSDKGNTRMGDMTEKQRKAVFVITHKYEDGKWNPRKNAKQLPDDWEKTMTFDDASIFIDKHGQKKEKNIDQY